MENRDYKPAAEIASEADPLLPNTNYEDPSSLIVNNEEEFSTKSLAWEELVTLLKTAGPMLGSQLASKSLTLVSVISTGHLSENALSASTLGSQTANATGICILIAFGAAMDVYFPQAWTSTRPHLMGLWAQRVVVVKSLMLLPIGLVWFNSEKLFSLLPNQNKEVIHLASVFMKYLFMGLPSFIFNQVSNKYFVSQKLFALHNWMILVLALVNLISHYLLMWGPEQIRLGFIGAPISTALSSYTASIISLVYGYRYVSREAWHPLSCRMFDNLNEVFLIGIAGIGQTASKVWAWEIITLFSSTFNEITFASQSVLIRTSTVFDNSAVAIAASARIGNLIGSKNARRAKITTYISLSLISIVNFITCVILLCVRHIWSYIFNKNTDVAKTVANSLPLVALYLLGNGISSVTTAILRVKGNQILAAVLNTSAYYLFALPPGYYLAFNKNLAINGLWSGISAAMLINAIIGIYFCLTTNWIHVVHSAAIKLEAKEKSKLSTRNRDLNLLD